MEFKTDCKLCDFKAWSGAVETLKRIIELGKCDEVESMFEDLFCDSLPSETTINDYLWFEDEYIAEYLGLTIDEFYGVE